MAVQKGKQGTKGQKQIHEENASTLRYYMVVILVSNVIFFVGTIFLYGELFTFKKIVICIIYMLTYVSSYEFMRRMAHPTYSDQGSLVDAGTDLNMEEGMAEHMKDLILLTAGVQTLSLISSYFNLLLCLAPLRAFYLLWKNFLGPWFFAPAAEVDEKKSKKTERKMKRR